MKNRLVSALFAAAAMLGVATGAAFAEARTIRFEVYVGPQHAVNALGLSVWAKQVEEATNGEVKVELTYPPVDPRDLMDRVRSGIADAAQISHGYTTGRFVVTKMAELPGYGGNAEQASRAFWNVYNKHFGEMNEHKGVVPIALFVHGPGMLHTREPIESIDDMKGLKIRTGAGVQAQIAERLDLVPVAAPVTKAQELLSQGVADGVMFSLETIKFLSLGDYVKYHYQLPGSLYTSSLAIVMNKDTLDGLTDSQKEAFWSVSGEELSALLGSAWDKSDQAALEEFGADSVITIEGDLKDEIDSALEGIDEEWIAEAKEAGATDPATALEEYRNEVRSLMKSN